MNAAHLHLMLVHLPIVLVPLGAILLLLGLWRNSDTVKSVGLSLFIASACFAGGAFLSGEDAEEIVEDLAGVVESVIEEHEESAVVALWLTIGLGILSATAMTAHRFGKRVAILIPATLLLSIAASASLAYTAQEGGKIRHPEAFSETLIHTENEND